MSRKRTVKSVKRSCDKLWSQIVRTKHPECQKCGKPATEAHHIHGRRVHTLRFELLNGLSLCAACHKFDPLGFEQSPNHISNQEVIRKAIGDEMKDWLDKAAVKTVHRKLHDYLELEESLKEQLKSYQKLYRLA